jgi:hypothetical protein
MKSIKFDEDEAEAILNDIIAKLNEDLFMTQKEFLDICKKRLGG